MHNLSNFFYIFPNLFFFPETNNAKINPLVIFNVFNTIIISVTLKSNFTKEKEMYEHIVFRI